MKVLEDLYYSKDHEWVRTEGGRALIGITDHAQLGLGDVESVKAASDVYTPVSGKVLRVNEELIDSPERINEDPYGSWLAELEITDENELEGLLSPEKYKALCLEEA